jgi:hypothetical protein
MKTFLEKIADIWISISELLNKDRNKDGYADFKGN